MTQTQLLPEHQAVKNRFVQACASDERIVAGFLGGSYAAGSADQFSDLDLYVVIADEAFDEFDAKRDEFLRRLGEPLFVEDFGLPGVVFFVFANGAEGELGIGRERNHSDTYHGPRIPLVDKKSLLQNTEPARAVVDAGEQADRLRQLVYWFWHEASHFVTAMGRNQLWWAHGQLEQLRAYCIKLARMRSDFLDADADNEPYFKLEKVLPVEHLAPLRETFCPLEWDPMLRSGKLIISFYKDLAPALAQQAGLSYPASLEQVVLRRLERLVEHR